MGDVDNDERLCFLWLGDLGDPNGDKGLFTADMMRKIAKEKMQKAFN